ncbi:hypothetical protein AMST5_01952 [freshwater sediment metagenome]|uniref:Uncharacterized protein n=1 Tax=freshwater sediment metagenome TaxID=556182 RepID=A0AA48M3L5_9ZZZZ
MDALPKIVILVASLIAFAAFQVFVSNPIAQKLLPTRENDSPGRKWAYDLVHKLVLFVFMFGVIVLLIAATGGWN